MKKNSIVTGGAGFIGSYLVEKLIEYGAKVTVIDSLVSGSLDNLKKVFNDITFYKNDIRDQAMCYDIFEKKKPEYVFHLAAQVSVPASADDPQTCFTTNVVGTFNLLEAARLFKVKRFIFSSSSAVYGNQDEPCVETMAYSPTSGYGFSKVMGEELCQQYTQCFGVPTLCLRYFNVFGERQNPHGPYAGVYVQFKNRMLHNEPIFIYGDGLQSRDFISVQEIVQANVLLAQLPDSECDGKSVNIATGKSCSIKTLFYELKEHFGYLQEPIYKPARVGDIVNSKALIHRFDMLKKQSGLKI